MSESESKLSDHTFCAFCPFIQPGSGQLFQKRIGAAVRCFLLFVITGIFPAVFVFLLLGFHHPFLTSWECLFILLGGSLLSLFLVVFYSALDTILWKSGTPMRVLRVLIVLTVVCYFTIAFELFLDPSASTDDNSPSKKGEKCASNMRHITLAILYYEGKDRRGLPTYSVDAQGKPLHSWRVLILPLVDESGLYEKIRLDEPWDSEYNRQFHSCAPRIFQCPAHYLGAVPQGSFYSVVSDSESASTGSPPRELRENNLILAERRTPVNWMDPSNEFSNDILNKGVNTDVMGISSNHPGGAFCALRSGRVQFLEEKKRD